MRTIKNGLHMSHTARWGASVVGVALIAGFTLIDHDFDTDNPWFYIGLTLVVVSSIAGHAIVNTVRTRTLNEEFETGYRAGFRAGRRARMELVPHHSHSGPISLHDRRKRRGKLQHGGIPKAAFREVSGDSKAP